MHYPQQSWFKKKTKPEAMNTKPSLYIEFSDIISKKVDKIREGMKDNPIFNYT